MPPPPVWAAHALSSSSAAAAGGSESEGAAGAGSAMEWLPFLPLASSSSSSSRLVRPRQSSRTSGTIKRAASPSASTSTSTSSSALTPSDVATLARAIRLAGMQPGPAQPAQTAAKADVGAEGEAAAPPVKKEEADTAAATALFAELASFMLPSHPPAWLLSIVRESAWAPSSSSSASSASAELLIPPHVRLDSLAPAPRARKSEGRRRRPAPPPGLAPALAPVLARGGPYAEPAYAWGTSSLGYAGAGGKQTSEEAEVERSLFASLSPPAARAQTRLAPRPVPPEPPAEDAGEAGEAHREAMRRYEEELESWRRERRAVREERRERRRREEQRQLSQQRAQEQSQEEWQDLSSPHLSLPAPPRPPKQTDVYSLLPAHIRAALPKRGRGRPSNAQRAMWEEALRRVREEAAEGEGDGEWETFIEEKEEEEEGVRSGPGSEEEEEGRAKDASSVGTPPIPAVAATPSGSGSGVSTPPLPPIFLSTQQQQDPWLVPAHAQGQAQRATSDETRASSTSFTSATSWPGEAALDPSLGDATAMVQERGGSSEAAAELQQQEPQVQQQQQANLFLPPSSPRTAGAAGNLFAPFSPSAPSASAFADSGPSGWRGTTPDAPSSFPAPAAFASLNAACAGGAGVGWTSSSPLRAVTPEPPAPWLSPEYATGAGQHRPLLGTGTTPLRQRIAQPSFAPALGFGSPLRNAGGAAASGGSGSPTLPTARWLSAQTQNLEGSMLHVADVAAQPAAAPAPLARSPARTAEQSSSDWEPPAKRPRGRPRKHSQPEPQPPQQPSSASADGAEAQGNTMLRLPIMPGVPPTSTSSRVSTASSAKRKPARPASTAHSKRRPVSRKPAAPAPAPLREVTTRNRRGPAPKMPLPTFWLTPQQRRERAARAQLQKERSESEEREEKGSSTKEMLRSFAEEINAG